VPDWVWERPVVYVTLGTFSNTNIAIFRLLMDALADLPVNAVVTIGRDQDPAALGASPPNAYVARFIPQAALLPRCAAAVHHGGAGTTFGILAHGLPSVVVPQSADNFTISARLAAAGAARELLPHEVSRESVVAAVNAVLEGTGVRAAAQQLAAEIAQMPGPGQVAAALAVR
jgi:MGT family glycosyltransferase